MVADLPTLPVFPGVSKFFIKSPGLPVRAADLSTVALFIFLLISVFLRIPKRKIKQEGNFLRLFSERNSDIVENYILTMQIFLAVLVLVLWGLAGMCSGGIMA